jgi:toxin-antitoxin system PIN domain toxin
VIGVDTNVVVYASDEFAPEHAVCRRLLLGVPASPDMPAEPLCIPWSVIYEFLRVVTHLRALRRPWSIPEAWAFVTVLLRSPHITVVGPGPGHAAAAERMLSAPGVRGNLVHDAHIAAVLAEHGVHRIYTRDQDFRRFPGLEVVDPLA